MALGLLGKKLGMSQLFNDAGEIVPVTLIQAGPCPILMKRESGRDGYSALQLGFDPSPDRLAIRPIREQGKKVAEKIKKEDHDRILAARVLAPGLSPEEAEKRMEEARRKFALGVMRFVREMRLEKDPTGYEVGQVLDVTLFKPGDRVDVIGVSKGRGFMGPYKRHGSRPGPATHGSMYHRRPGAMGASSDPSRVYKLKPSAGQDGASRVTALNLTVAAVDAERNLLIVRGSVPGSINGYVIIRPTVKVRRQPATTHLR